MVLIIKHVQIEGPGIIQDILEKKGYKIKVIELEEGEELPFDFKNIKAVIIMGGPMNVYEEEKYPFLKEEDKFIKKIMEKNIPILGICLGAQILAKACGAKVRKANVKEIGWYEVSLTEKGKKDILFKELGKELEVFQWHEDEFEIPEGGVLLAESKECKNQAFKIGKNAYGLQFHIEVTSEMVEVWLEDELNSKEQEKQNWAKGIIEETYNKKEQFLMQVDKILSNFFL
jgi:GMP synthase-like glutamine amidotransferase